MSVLEGERVVQYVVDGAGRRQAALVRMDEWERILGWLDTGCFSWQAIYGLGELWAAGGDPEQAGWTEWSSFRREWLPDVDLGEEPSFPYAVRVRPAVLQETARMTDDLRRRAIRLIDRLAVKPRQKRGFRLNLMPVEVGWEVRWCCVDNWHIIHAIEEDLHQEVVLTIFKRMPYPGS